MRTSRWPHKITNEKKWKNRQGSSSLRKTYSPFHYITLPSKVATRRPTVRSILINFSVLVKESTERTKTKKWSFCPPCKSLMYIYWNVSCPGNASLDDKKEGSKYQIAIAIFTDFYFNCCISSYSRMIKKIVFWIGYNVNYRDRKSVV